ncbi:unnamed protein product, partial [Staurois parvus]
MGTGGYHCRTQVGGTDGHRWVAQGGTGGWHCSAQVGGTAGHIWVALIISALMISA